MNYDIQVGFSRVDITPPMGIDISGYFIKRIAKGVLDPLEINTLAVKKDNATVLLISVDTLGMSRAYIDTCKQAITEKTGIPAEAIYVHSTHTHTGGRLGAGDCLTEQEKDYHKTVALQMANGAMLAIQDLDLAKMGWAVSRAEKVAFNRRYLMKDGTTKTNPGVNNPDIVKCIGLLDERVNVVRFNRKDGKNYVLINFGNHPDCVGGDLISADWPGFTRRIFERAVENSKCIFFNGAQGDINHVNVFPKDGDLNEMFIDFDDVARGYTHSKHIGNVMAGSAMAVYEKVKYVDVDAIKYKQTILQIPANKPKPEEMEEARYIDKMHAEGRDAELPYKGMLLTTMVAGAMRKIRLENAPDTFPFLCSAIKIGPVAMLGMPGEPFAGVGIGIKEAQGYDMICPTCNTNAKEGYFPMKDSYDEGGYEANTSNFKSGVAEILIEEGKKILDGLRK